jgi:GGDEF domain-containing protein
MTAALAIAIDDSSDLTTRHGAASLATLHRTVAQRLTGVLRDGDILAPDGPAGFVVALAPTRRLDTEALIQLSARAQRLMADPVAMDGFRLHATLSVGYCLPRRPAEMEADA